MSLRALLGFLALLVANATHADQVLVAVASNFAQPMKAIAADFEAATGHEVNLAIGSSGKIYAQIINGAPYDIFLSADQEKPELLVKGGFGDESNRFTYAIGTLVLWSPKNQSRQHTINLLNSNNFRKLALANPRLAPYGRAAVETLQYLKLEDATEKNWIVGENIAQTFQFAYSGGAELGFVALSQILKDGEIIEGSAWEVPEHYHSPIKQDAILLKNGKTKKAVMELLAYLKSDGALTVLNQYGYRQAD